MKTYYELKHLSHLDNVYIYIYIYMIWQSSAPGVYPSRGVQRFAMARISDNVPGWK